jgi:hypothetical protein
MLASEQSQFHYWETLRTSGSADEPASSPDLPSAAMTQSSFPMFPYHRPSYLILTIVVMLGFLWNGYMENIGLFSGIHTQSPAACFDLDMRHT